MQGETFTCKVLYELGEIKVRSRDIGQGFATFRYCTVSSTSEYFPHRFVKLQNRRSFEAELCCIVLVCRHCLSENKKLLSYLCRNSIPSSQGQYVSTRHSFGTFRLDRVFYLVNDIKAKQS